MTVLRLLAVLLCYNDGDLLEDLIRGLLEQNHHVIAWDHGCTGETDEVFRRVGHELLKTRFHRENLIFMNFIRLCPPPFETLCCEL